VKVLDSGARGSTTTFAERGIGDVLLAWENEAYLSLKELGADKFEIITPSLSILAEPPVTVIDKVVDKRGTRKVARPTSSTCTRPKARNWPPRHFYRPQDAKIAARHAGQFVKTRLITIDKVVRRLAQRAEGTLLGRRRLRPDLRSRRQALTFRRPSWSASGASALYRGLLSRSATRWSI
jgi:sulfate/thiosulfate-binding protein